MKLKKGIDYTVSYKNNKKAGTAYVVISGIGRYNGSVCKKFTIKKASVQFKNTSITLKKAKLKTSNKSYSLIKKSDGGTVKVTYYNNGKITKKLCKKYISVSKKGVLKVKKDAEKGKYKINIEVAEKGNYKKTKKTIIVTVK